MNLTECISVYDWLGLCTFYTVPLGGEVDMDADAPTVLRRMKCAYCGQWRALDIDQCPYCAATEAEG